MRYFVLILFILISASDAKALAVASDYLENNMLVLEEGSSAIYSIRLQNTESYEAAFKVDYDNRFMKVTDFKEQYVVAPKSSYRIEFNVTAPNYDANSNLFVLGYTVHQLTPPTGGGIPFLTKINKNFKLQVTKKPAKLDFASAAYAAALLVIAYALIKIKANKNKKINKKPYKIRKVNK